MRHVKKGDQVVVLSGKDNGKKGEILDLLTDKGRAVVKGINMVKKTVKRDKQNNTGGIIDIESPVHISNLQVYCDKCGKGVRTKVVIDGDIKKRVCVKCGKKFD